MKVFTVHAVFRDSRAGPRPLPFFAKVDVRDKIRQEMENYENYVSHFIPFNLRPNLDRSRCLIGRTLGLMVGNFVERAEPLIVVARRNHAQTPLYNLFDNTLRGWKLQSEVTRGKLAARIPGPFAAMRMMRIPRRWRDARQLGAKAEPVEIERQLADLPECYHRSGPIHGDLHGHNVMVSGLDSILIDFAHTINGPLAADPASLDVDLAFDGDGSTDRSWKNNLAALYSWEALERVPNCSSRPHDWLWAAVRQIRILALAEQASAWEYATAVAAYLLRRSMYPGCDAFDNQKRAFAYVLAERLIANIRKKLGGGQ